MQPQRSRRIDERRRDLASIVAALVIGLTAALLATGLSVGAAVDAAVHPVAMAVLLAVVCVPLIRWAVAGDQLLFKIVLGGLAAKCVGTYLRFTLTGSGDNGAYHAAGTNIARWLSEDIVWPGDLPSQFGGDGSGRLAYGVGWIYYFTGANRLTGFVVFAFLGFVGTLFFYRAAVDAIPQLDKLRYALLLFYLPSMLFWPSTIGKEAWMICFIGLAAMGISAFVRHQLSPSSLVALAIGLVLAGQVRPHIAALALVALVAATAWPRIGEGHRARQILIVVLTFGLLTIAMDRVADFFGSENVELTTILDFTQSRTAEGSSKFAPTRVTGPLTLIPGALSVLFRPFLIEAETFLQLLSSFESLGLIVLAGFSFSRVRQVPRLFLTNGYVRFAVIYTLGFAIAFSVISNFGILTRQRVQLYPLFLILFAMSAPKEISPDEVARADDAVRSAPTESRLGS